VAAPSAPAAALFRLGFFSKSSPFSCQRSLARRLYQYINCNKYIN